MFETKSSIFLIAGLLFFAIAFLGNAVVPMAMLRNMPEKSTAELVTPVVERYFEDLEIRYPEAFKKAFGTASKEKATEALNYGKKVYVGEGCWHCHSQFVRPVSRESERWGAVAKSIEFQNELQRPVLFGTRRVGPDLSREGGRRGSDWHAAHFYKPKSIHPWSVMPSYPWFFDGDASKPNKRGLSLILYMQWLGSWHPTFPYYEAYENGVDKPLPGTLEIK